MKTPCLLWGYCVAESRLMTMPMVHSSASLSQKGGRKRGRKATLANGSGVSPPAPAPRNAAELIHYLAPVSHFPASAGTEVAPLGRVWPPQGGAVGIHVGAALHAPPVGPQPARGGALPGRRERWQRLRAASSRTAHPAPPHPGGRGPPSWLLTKPACRASEA